MKKLMLIFLFIVTGICLYGCKSIHIGGSAGAGTVSGSGQVTVSIPQEEGIAK